MDFCGIVCEFNPFHNGHKYLIESAKKITGKEVLCIMSGYFIQRGAPAIQDKYERAENAIKAGANAVIELPTIFACSNAENFASGAIKILSKLNVSHLAFGVENTDLETLKEIARLKVENSERFVQAFKNEIQNGINYNTALKRSIAKTIHKEDILEILNKPNNVLAIEYITAIYKLKAKIEPVAINRCDNGFYSSVTKDEFLSATSIRNLILDNQDYKNYIPKNAKIDNIFDKTHEKTLKTLQICKIRESSPETLETFYDYNEGIEYRIKNYVTNGENYDQMLSDISTPRYRIPRVNKLLLYPLLNITKKVVLKSKSTKPVCKLIAINRNNKSLIKEFNKNKISLIITNKDYKTLSKNQTEIINIDLKASMIYNSVVEKNGNLDKLFGTIFVD